MLKMEGSESNKGTYLDVLSWHWTNLTYPPHAASYSTVSSPINPPSYWLSPHRPCRMWRICSQANKRSHRDRRTWHLHLSFTIEIVVIFIIVFITTIAIVIEMIVHSLRSYCSKWISFKQNWHQRAFNWGRPGAMLHHQLSA